MAGEDGSREFQEGRKQERNVNPALIFVIYLCVRVFSKTRTQNATWLAFSSLRDFWASGGTKILLVFWVFQFSGDRNRTDEERSWEIKAWEVGERGRAPGPHGTFRQSTRNHKRQIVVCLFGYFVGLLNVRPIRTAQIIDSANKSLNHMNEIFDTAA